MILLIILHISGLLKHLHKVSLRRVSGCRVLRRFRVLFLTWLDARPTGASAPRRSCTVNELGRQSAESGIEHGTGATLNGHY